MSITARSSASMNAPAKINLFLDVSGIRDDGYHNISSIMQSIDLCDIVSVKLVPSHAETYAISIKCSDTSLSCGEKNLAYKAADLYLSYIGADSTHAEISIEKNIPISAGLAGGSTDAAAVLILLNRLSGNLLSIEKLCELGKKIGADIPFCIRAGISGGAMIAEGIGEKLSECPSLPSDVSIVVCAFDIQISTPWAYGEIDRLRSSSISEMKNFSIAEAIKNNILYNIFEAAVIPYHPVINEVKQKLIASGASGALMSGSGASVFGIFSNHLEAKKSAEMIQTEFSQIRTFMCKPYTIE